MHVLHADFVQFRKTAELSLLVKLCVGSLVGATLAVAVVGVARTPNAGLENWVLAPALVLALWAVVLPIAHGLWQKLGFLPTRRVAVRFARFCHRIGGRSRSHSAVFTRRLH